MLIVIVRVFQSKKGVLCNSPAFKILSKVNGLKQFIP